MPQLMPLFWNMSLFMVMLIMLVMVMLYFVKLLDFDLFYLNSNEILMNNSCFMLFKW